MQKRKLIRITTVDFAQSDYMKGQNRYMNQFFDVIGAASDTGKLEQVAKDEGVRMVNIPMDRKINPRADIKSMLMFYKLFRKERPDIINSNSPKSSLLSMIAGWLAHVPIRIYTVTGLRYQGAHGLLRWILINSERIACLFANHVVPESQGVLHCLKEEHITRKSLKVIWNGNINGVNTHHWSLAEAAKDYKTSDSKLKAEVRNRLKIAEDDFVFVFVGRIVHDKGMNELAEAMRRLTVNDGMKNVKLLLVGDFETKYGPLEPENNDFLHNDRSVVYAGYVDDVRPFLAAADALAFPSYREGFPNVVLQAGAMGLPSIVTDINGANEVIRDGINGKIIAAPLDRKGNMIYREGKPLMGNALYETMKWFLEHKGEVERMAGNARRIITERYEQRDVWKAWKDYYLRLLEDEK